jgi:hypothetical protein
MSKEMILEAVKGVLNEHPESNKFYVTTDLKVFTDAIAAVQNAQELSSGNPTVETVTRDEAERFVGQNPALNEDLAKIAPLMPSDTLSDSESATVSSTETAPEPTIDELFNKCESARLFLETTKSGGDEIAIAAAQDEYEKCLAEFEAKS